MANNLRDIATDVTAGKRTLAVRVGEVWARRLCIYWVAGGFFFAMLPAVNYRWVLLVVLVVFPAVLTMQKVRTATGRDLIAVLRNIGLIELAVGLLLGLGLALRRGLDAGLIGLCGRLAFGFCAGNKGVFGGLIGGNLGRKSGNISRCLRLASVR